MTQKFRIPLKSLKISSARLKKRIKVLYNDNGGKYVNHDSKFLEKR